MYNKSVNGLQLIDGTRLSLANYNPQIPSITINGKKLSHRDINLGNLKIDDAGKLFTLDNSDNTYYELLNTNSQIQVKFDEESQQVGKVQEGQIVVAGNNLIKQNSPAPFVYVDESGRLGSSNLWGNIWIANVMGYVDVDKASSTYNHGLCPAGSANHGGLFLRKDGQWGQPSLYTGSVSETFLSLQDTPLTYTENIDKYLRVSYSDGGSIVFDDIDTSKVKESTNLYYTEERVENKITSKLEDNSIKNISVAGTIICNEILAQSDARIKRNVKPLGKEACLDVIDQLEPKQYNFINQPKQRYGLIAQEMEKVLPELVNTTQGSKSVNYVELVPFLIGSIKELKEQIQCMQCDMQMMQDKIKYM